MIKGDSIRLHAGGVVASRWRNALGIFDMIKDRMNFPFLLIVN